MVNNIFLIWYLPEVTATNPLPVSSLIYCGLKIYLDSYGTPIHKLVWFPTNV